MCVNTTQWEHCVSTHGLGVNNIVNYSVHINFGVTFCVNILRRNIKCKFGRHTFAVQTGPENRGNPDALSLKITRSCQNPINVMTYDQAAKTDTATDWKALWISFGDGAFSKKNDSHGSDLYFNRSSRKSEGGVWIE